MEASASRRLVKEDVDLQPWLPVCLNSEEYLLKSYFNPCDTSYKIILYDSETMDMWREEVDVEKFGQKWKSSNPNIEASYETLLNYVKISLEESRVASTLKLEPEGETQINLIIKTKLKGKIPFNWKFECQKCNLMVKEILIDPLFNVIEELSRQQSKLIKLLNDKDKEIEDYKDQGSTTTRSNLSTLPFEESSFQTQCMVDEEFILNSQKTSIEALTKPNISKLLRSIMLNKQALQNKVVAMTCNTTKNPTFDTVGSHSVGLAPNVSSWSGVAGRHPESILDDKIDIDPSDIETQSPVKSPIDEEKERREKLRQRLENDEKKSKNKKRKINL